MALGMLLAIASPERPAAAATTKSCATLERRLDARLRRGLRACGRGVVPSAALRCAAEKRAQHVASLSARGCSSPAWTVTIETIPVSAETVALAWTSRLNWARLAVRSDDPIASSVRLPGERFRNLLLLDPSGDVAAVLDYVADIEARAEDVDDGLPGAIRGGGRPAFPSISDRSPGEAVDVLLQVAEACMEGGEPSMFADGGGRRIGGVSGDTFKDAQDPNGAPDGGGDGLFAAQVVAAIINAIIDAVDDDEPPPADEPAEPEDGQCVEDDDGQCADDSEPDDDQTPATTSTTVPPPPPPPPPSGSPTSDVDPDGERCPLTVEAMTAICDSVEWQTPTCRAMVRGVNACADESLIKPAPDGEVPCSGEGMSREEYEKLECERRGGIAQPSPDGELVCVLHDPEAPAPDLPKIDPCTGPETQGTPECDGQGGVGVGVDPLPPTPRPDPRAGSLRARF